MSRTWWVFVVALVACGENPGGGAGGGSGTAGGNATAGGSTAGGSTAGGSTAGGSAVDAGAPSSIAGCQIFPSNHIFNTRIDGLPVHPNSAAFIGTIGGTVPVHLDLGQDENQASGTYYGIPYNVVNGATLTWSNISYDMSGAGDESDCAVGAGHTVTAPCASGSGLTIVGAQFPIPPSPLIESGLTNTADGDDHHLLVIDSTTCRLWESYQAYNTTPWEMYCSATWDLRSNALRPDTWTSGDAAGLPLVPFLLRADEASTGVINHPMRFTLAKPKIHTGYIWPARHGTGSGTATSTPYMGQVFRLKSNVNPPGNATAQTRAIFRALQLYGIYLADIGSDMYIQGEPKSTWSSMTISQVQALHASDFEAVDMSAITSRAGFDVNSGAVPP